MKTLIKPVILCGGSGTRLWPLSRTDMPKQFIEFPNSKSEHNSLFRYAVNRITAAELGRYVDTVVLPPLIVAAKEAPVHHPWAAQEYGHRARRVP